MLVTYRGKGAVALTQGNWKNQACLGCKYEKKGSGIIPTNLQRLQPLALYRTLGGDGKTVFPDPQYAAFCLKQGKEAPKEGEHTNIEMAEYAIPGKQCCYRLMTAGITG